MLCALAPHHTGFGNSWFFPVLLWPQDSLWVSKHLSVDGEQGVPGISVTITRLSVDLTATKSHSIQVLTGTSKNWNPYSLLVGM